MNKKGSYHVIPVPILLLPMHGWLGEGAVRMSEEQCLVQKLDGADVGTHVKYMAILVKHFGADAVLMRSCLEPGLGRGMS